ncbi:MAG TPA: type II toxin-antitoxin system CcdA family antitoxin [Burkholderiaceae bacterium]|nr:type II toxin-antitoxin system CcdA family antitoxin [Burkholderiaceae bacterium]HNB47178.1 type II toxin-antitoxin system CcdA family antitoxin [Burkholderiaceae bacterium]
MEASAAVPSPRPVEPATKRRPTNITLPADVLAEAKSLGINISQECEAHLRSVLARERERRWREEHADFIAAYNRSVEAEGLPLAEWRSF